MGQEVLRDGECVVFLNDDHPNVLIVTWTGAATLQSVERFYAWCRTHIAEAEAAGRKLVLVNDAIDAERPEAAVREAFARHHLTSNTVVAAPVVLTSALVRGAMTAVGWIMGDRMKGVSACATMQEAFELARASLAECNVLLDMSALADYRRPSVKARAASG
ncbi:MAG: hypothetical protein JNK04_11770 [Myxococcales bacterium]|nr:hypothetical protein [Myxococcales bacterium]